MQSTADQMELFEKLNANPFENMTLVGFCIHAIVRWKSDEKQLKAERHSASIHLEQERLFQEQLQDDAIAKRRLQQANIELTAQLQRVRSELKNREEALHRIEEARDELAVQLREAKLTAIGLEGELRRQKSSTPSPVKEQVAGYDSPFWKALHGEAGENQGELGRNFGGAKARRATVLVQDHEGVYSQMNETEKLQEVFQNTAGMLGENQPHDLQRMQNSAQTVMKSQAAFLEAVREAGVCTSSKLVVTEPLTAEGLVKLTKTIEGLVQGHYQKRSEWHDMRDVNGYLATIFAKPEVNRQALAKALRAEELELVTISYNTIYIDATKAMSSDPKRADKVAKIMESRAQDQHLLAAALGSLLGKHSPTLKERIEGRDSTQVTLNDLDDKGFTVMVWAELLLDVAHVRDNVQELLEIFAYPSTFVSRFHGNILTFTRSLDADLDMFQNRNGLITKRQISKLLTLQVLNDSMEVSIKNFRKEVVDNVHQGFTKEFHSFKLMTERYDHVLAAAISFQRTHYGETFAKMPVERDEWSRKCAKSGLVCNFASNDNMPPCPLCGGRHPLTSGCDVTVNMKRVCDESSTVLRGIGELMGGIAKIQAEYTKGLSDLLQNMGFITT